MTELPREFMDKMEGLLGEEADAFFASYDKPRKYGLRRNACKCDEALWREVIPFALSKVPWTEDGYYYQPEAQPGRHVYHEAGMYYIQEPSAMSAAYLLNVQPGDRVGDLCAAPGGKSTQIASRLLGTGLLVANELYPARARILSQNIERMGIRNAVVLNEKTEHMAELFPEFFDKLMVDAPCSGEGMFRKDEQARTEWSREQVEVCADRQLMILEHAAVMLRTGGEMIYSTCTFSPEENEGVILRFLQRHPEFEVMDLGVPKGFSPGRPEWTDAQGENLRTQLARTLRIFPHLSEGEGHFVAKLTKKGENHFDGAIGILPDKRCCVSEWERFMDELQLPAFKGVYHMFGDILYLVPEDMIELKGIRVERAGLELGTMKKNRFEPAHALAMTLKPEECARVVSLSVEQAGHYLHGEIVPGDAENGWVLVTVDGLSIGWGKCVNGVIKNHYPKGLRR